MRTIFCALLIALLTGCASIGPEAKLQKLRAGLSDREVLMFDAVLSWYSTARNPKFGYRFDEKNSEFTDRVKQRLASAIPEFQRNDSLEWFYVYLPKVVFPEEPYGYVEVVVGDPFYAERYADVFRKEDGAWHLIDSVGIASGTLDSLMTEFNWSAYRRDLKKRI